MEIKENSKIANIKSLENETQLAVKSENSPYITPFYFMDFYDEGAIKRFIKSTERLIRQSKEYSTYIEGLRTTVSALNHDNILSNITAADADLELHHYPFSLYDLIEICMSQRLFNKERFTTFAIAKEVMELHYKHMVGLVSLSETTHDLAHLGSIFISEKQIFGDYKAFMSLYNNSIPVSLKNKISEMEKLSKDSRIVSDFKGLL